MKLKNLVINICIIILVIAIIIVGVLIFKKYYNNYINEQDIAKFIEQNYNDDSNIVNNENLELEYKGYKVLGIIKIPKLNLNYPIIDPLKDKDKALNISIIKFAGNKINDFGNVTLAGHNYYDNTMFAKLHEIKILDTLQIIDNNKNAVMYQVYDKYNVSPMDTECLETKDENVKELTLITCTKGNSERLVIKAKEIK